MYSTVCSVLYEVPFNARQRWSSRGHGLNLEDSRGQLTMSLVLGFKSLVLALDCQSLALASDCQSLALASNYQALALEVVLAIGVGHSNFLPINPSSPAFILTSFKKYLDFIPEQSCSDGCVDSWKMVQQEANFQVGYSITCWKISSTAQPPRHW